jgi:hypothetical protein
MKNLSFELRIYNQIHHQKLLPQVSRRGGVCSLLITVMWGETGNRQSLWGNRRCHGFIDGHLEIMDTSQTYIQRHKQTRILILLLQYWSWWNKSQFSQHPGNTIKLGNILKKSGTITALLLYLEIHRFILYRRVDSTVDVFNWTSLLNFIFLHANLKVRGMHSEVYPDTEHRFVVNSEKMWWYYFSVDQQRCSVHVEERWLHILNATIQVHSWLFPGFSEM